MKAIVVGCSANVYGENDYVLTFLYRTSSIQNGAAGLPTVEGV